MRLDVGYLCKKNKRLKLNSLNPILLANKKHIISYPQKKILHHQKQHTIIPCIFF